METINNNEMESTAIIDNEMVQGDEEIIQNSAEEKDFLNSLNENDDESFEGKVDKTLLLAQGKMTATALLGAGEGILKQLFHKDFAIDPTQKENVSDSFAPLFVKHGGELPPWVLQYKEEIMFTFAMGTLCFTSYAQVKALKKMDAEKVVNKKGKEGDKTDATNQTE